MLSSFLIEQLNVVQINSFHSKPFLLLKMWECHHKNQEMPDAGSTSSLSLFHPHAHESHFIWNWSAINTRSKLIDFTIQLVTLSACRIGDGASQWFNCLAIFTFNSCRIPGNGLSLIQMKQIWNRKWAHVQCGPRNVTQRWLEALRCPTEYQLIRWLTIKKGSQHNRTWLPFTVFTFELFFPFNLRWSQ